MNIEKMDIETKIRDLKDKLRSLKTTVDNKKFCSKCFIEKDISEYRKKNKTQLRPDCIECQNKRNSEYYKKHRDNKKIVCECGTEVVGSYIKEHRKSKSCKIKTLNSHLKQIEETAKQHITETDKDVKEVKKKIKKQDVEKKY